MTPSPGSREAILCALQDVPAQWKLIPCNGNKCPTDPETGRPLRGWQNPDSASTADTMAAIVQRSDHVRAVGLLLGEPSGGLLAIDFDGPAAEDIFVEIYGSLWSAEDLPLTVGWTSTLPGRRQLLYQVPIKYWPRLQSRQYKAENGDGLEFRWNGRQSVFTGQHPDTSGYQWIDSPQERQIAEAPAWMLEPLLRDLTHLPQPPPLHSSPVSGDDQTRAIDALHHLRVRGHGEHDEWIKIGMALHAIFNGSTDGLNAWDAWSAGATDGSYQPRECERRWRSFHPRPDGIAAGFLFGLAQQEGWINPNKGIGTIDPVALLQPLANGHHQAATTNGTTDGQQNQQGQQRASGQQGQQRASGQQGQQRASGQQGQHPSTADRLQLLDGFADQLFSSDAALGDRLIYLRHRAAELGLNLRDTDLQRRLWAARRRHAGAVAMFTPGMLDDSEEEAWAWDGILMAGDTNLLVAKPKVGKTTFLLDGISRWHQGHPSHLDRAFHGPCPPVLIAGTDMPRRRWLSLLYRFGLAEKVETNHFRLPDHGPIRGLFSQESPVYFDEEGIALITEQVRHYPGCLLIVDSYAKLAGPLGLKEASSDYAGPMGDLQEAVAPYNVTLVVIHHSGHTRGGEGAVAACRGTSALPAAVSHVIALDWLNRSKGSNDKRVVLQTEGRGGEPLQLLLEQFDDGFRCYGDAADAFEEQRILEVEESLGDRQVAALDLVRERWDQMRERTTSGDVIDELNLRGPNAPRIARRILSQLVGRGLIQESKESTDVGAVVRYWPSLATEVSEVSPVSPLSGVSPVSPPTGGEELQGVPSSCSLSPMSGVSPVSPPPSHREPKQTEEKREIADARREGTLRTLRTGGTGNRERGHLGVPSSPTGDTLENQQALHGTESRQSDDALVSDDLPADPAPPPLALQSAPAALRPDSSPHALVGAAKAALSSDWRPITVDSVRQAIADEGWLPPSNDEIAAILDGTDGQGSPGS